ncbi:hypothetical protein ACJX0J_012571 [Zea mays]
MITSEHDTVGQAQNLSYLILDTDNEKKYQKGLATFKHNFTGMDLIVQDLWSKEGGLCSQHFVTAPITSLERNNQIPIAFLKLEFRGVVADSLAFHQGWDMFSTLSYTGDNNYMRMKPHEESAFNRKIS